MSSATIEAYTPVDSTTSVHPSSQPSSLPRPFSSAASWHRQPRAVEAPLTDNEPDLGHFEAAEAVRSLCISPEGNLSRAYCLTKRLLDIAGALALLVVFAPVMAALLLVLTVTTRGKPLFWQWRSGHCGRPFRVFKFRTMVADAQHRQHEVANEVGGPIFKNRHDPRITRLGRILRKTSLDETPQLLSVLWGRMSLVGPRPLASQEVARFTPQELRRLAVKPGLTCLWQVSGRSDIGFDEWTRLDLWYVRNQGLWTDLKLLLRTPMSVLTGRGAY